MEIKWVNQYEFQYFEGSNLQLIGYIDFDRISRFGHEEYQKLVEMIRNLGMDPLEEKRNIESKVDMNDLPNFLFIRSIFDYANIAPSSLFTHALLHTYQKFPWLFRPNDSLWNEILNLPYEKKITKIMIPLLGLSGLSRVSFEQLAKYWINIVTFIRDFCEGDVTNFFIKMIQFFRITDNGNALEELHKTLLKEENKKKVSLNFPYGDKNGRLLLSLMSPSVRGFGLLKGVRDEHLKNFNVPVDSQVIRVTLNLGLIRLAWVRTTIINLRSRKKTFTIHGLSITRSDFAEPCQYVWKNVAERLDIFPVDIDYYVYSLGSIICKRFGKLCFLCPLQNICWSVEKGSVAESRGVDVREGCFSFGRADPNVDRLILRICEQCPCYQGTLHGNYCVRNVKYATKQYV
jgi:hypothetical protein